PKDLCGGCAFFVRVLDTRSKKLDVLTTIFCCTYRHSNNSRNDLFFIKSEVLNAGLDHFLRIVGVVNRKGLFVSLAEFVDVLPQDAHAETMKCRDQRERIQLLTFQKLFDPPPHFSGGLVCKRN